MDPDRLQPPGFTLTRDPHRLVFSSPERVIIWKVTDEELAALAAGLRIGARQALGRGRGDQLLVELVQEAVLSFEGERGELRESSGSLRVEDLSG